MIWLDWLEHEVWTAVAVQWKQRPLWQAGDSSKPLEFKAESQLANWCCQCLLPCLLTTFIFQNRVVSSYCPSGIVPRPTTGLGIWRGWVLAGPCQKMPGITLIICSYKQLILASETISLTLFHLQAKVQPAGVSPKAGPTRWWYGVNSTLLCYLEHTLVTRKFSVRRVFQRLFWKKPLLTYMERRSWRLQQDKTG